MKKLTPAQAEQQGFTIDRHCYPWVAYKGERFKPMELHQVYTDTEAVLLEAVQAHRELALRVIAIADNATAKARLG
jgi:hypothetical protein